MPTDTKTALMDSAERAARTRGFDGFSYADLSQDVGIRKASIHHHFPSKANLSVAIMQRYTSTLETICADIDASSQTGGAQLRALIEVYRAALDSGKSLCLCVSFSTSRESLPPEVIAQISQFRAMMIGWLRTTFENGKKDGSIALINDPALEATATLPLLEGAQLAARAEENPALFDVALRLLMQRIAP
jgi:TetR/AcrR family transcriptional repressor of nem operon